MTRQTLLGLLFLLVGLAIVATVLAPVVAAVVAKTPAPAISLSLLVIGIGLALFGALLVPSSGVGPAMTQLTVVLSNTSLPFVGGRRAGDAPAPPTGPPEGSP